MEGKSGMSWWKGNKTIRNKLYEKFKTKMDQKTSKSLMSEEIHISRKGTQKLGLKGGKWQTSWQLCVLL